MTRERAERAGDDPGRKMDADAVAKNVARRRRSVGFVMVVWLWWMAAALHCIDIDCCCCQGMWWPIWIARRGGTNDREKMECLLARRPPTT